MSCNTILPKIRYGWSTFVLPVRQPQWWLQHRPQQLQLQRQLTDQLLWKNHRYNQALGVSYSSSASASTTTATPSNSIPSALSSQDEEQDGPDYASIPPQHPLPILSSSNDDNNKIPSQSFTQQLQHTLQKNLSISYQQNIIVQGETLFQSALQQSQLPEWYGPGRIGRDFRSRHALLTFHVWLLHKRLLHNEQQQQSSDPNPSTRKDYNMCKDIDVELFNIFWDNTTCRIRALNVYELSVNMHLRNVQQYTFMHLVQYDHCYSPALLRNPTERLNYLRQLIAIQWIRPKFIDKRNKAYDKGIILSDEDLTADDVEDVYRCTCDHIDRIVHYIDAQYCNVVLDLPYEHFTNGQIRYVSLPTFANVHDTSTPITPPPTTTLPPTNSITTESTSTAAMTTNTLDELQSLMGNIPFAEYADMPVPCNPEDVLPYPWVTNITNSGKIYYWNTMTRVSSWIRPVSIVDNGISSSTTKE